MSIDPILVSMATELKTALENSGADPKRPPADSRPPADRAFEHYRALGGEQYTDPDKLVSALVEEVVRQAKSA